MFYQAPVEYEKPKSSGFWGDLLGGTVGKIGGAVLGGLLGSAVPVVGTTLGAGIGSALGGTLGSAGGQAAEHGITGTERMKQFQWRSPFEDYMNSLRAR